MAKCSKCHFEYRKDGSCFCSDLAQGQVMNIQPDFHDEYYDHGLGTIVRSRSQRRRLMREKDLIEVGNERCAVDGEARGKRFDQRWEKQMMEVNKQAYQELSRHPQWN